jgi:hypothetical protein
MQEVEPTSVFTDDSGTRARVITWTVRSAIALIMLAGLAVTFSLVTGVPLPTPVGPLDLPGTSESHASTGSSDQAAPVIPAAPVTTPSASATSNPAAIQAGPTSAAGTPRRASSRPSSTSSAPTATPTPTPTKAPASKANHGVASTKAPRATPTHLPGGPAPTPPGRSK